MESIERELEEIKAHAQQNANILLTATKQNNEAISTLQQQMYVIIQMLNGM